MNYNNAEKIIEEKYKEQIERMPSFSKEMIQQIEKEIEKVKKEEKEYYEKKRGIIVNEDDNTDEYSLKIPKDKLDEMNKEIDRLNKEYNINVK